MHKLDRRPHQGQCHYLFFRVLPDGKVSLSDLKLALGKGRMNSPPTELAMLIRKLMRPAHESKDKSLFSLLLLVEEEIRGGGRSDTDSRIEKAKGARVFNQRGAMIANLSRYVE